MDITENIRFLNDMMQNHIDILWQADWFDFYDQAMELHDALVSRGSMRVLQANEFMYSTIGSVGDCLSQERWYDVCDAVCALTIALADEDVVDINLVADYPMLYGEVD